MSTPSRAQADRATAQHPADEEVAVPHRWRNLTILSVASIADGTESNAVTSVYPSIAAALRLNNGNLGLIAALGKLASVPAGPFWVWLATKIGRRRVLSLTAFLCGAFGIAAGFSPNFGTLLIFTMLMAMTAIGVTPIATAVLSDSFPDRARPRAMSVYFAVLQIASLALAPAISVLVGLHEGWRWALGSLGVFCILVAGLVLLLFRDPGVGAADRGRDQSPRTRVRLGDVLSLFKIPTYSVMMVSRLLSGHLLILIFGVQFLVTVRGIGNGAAIIVALPFGIGYTIAALLVGTLMTTLDNAIGVRSRVVILQFAQVFFAIVAFLATQIAYDNFAIYALLWGLMGAAQGMNPPANRPIVAGVVRPELRGQAFAVWLSIFETIGWAVFSLIGGYLAVSLGLQKVFLIVLVVLMLVNAAWLSILYVTYPRDARKAEQSFTTEATEH